MRALWNVLLVVTLVNMLGLAVGVAWLFGTDRVNRERVDAVVQLFGMTIEDEAQQRETALALETEAQEQATELARLQSVGAGPITIYDRLDTQRQGNQLALQRIQRIRRGVHDLQKQLDLTKQMLADQRVKFDAEVKAFEQTKQQENALAQDENFKQAVGMYEGVKPKQAKQMFEDLAGRGRLDEVVRYLAAMQPRKAAAVLKQFKSDQEIAMATELVQRLREKGVGVSTDLTQPASEPTDQSTPS